jgi:dephospho-CoA kinase
MTVIGIAGKVGSGKSFLGEHIARETGFKLVKLDYQVGQVINKPILKQMLQRRIKHKIPKASPDMQLFPLWKNLDRDFSAFENALVMRFLNKKLTRIINKAKQPIIVDFTILPILKAAKKLDAMYLVQSDEEQRYSYLARRDGITADDARRIDRFMNGYYQKSDKHKFCQVINNDYQQIPAELTDIVEKLKQSCKNCN